MMRRRLLAALSLPLLMSCGGSAERAARRYELPASKADEYPTAYVSVVVADPPGADLAAGSGEHVIIANNASIRIDMGGWWLDVDGERLPLGIGRQIEVGAELRVHIGSGTSDEGSVFMGLDTEVLDDTSGVVILRDSAGSEVARFAYGLHD